MPGPIPKRSEERRRTNTDGTPVEKVDLAELIAKDVAVPTADTDWHPAAYSWYESLKSSGQSIFYEPSDWALAYLLAETISRELEPQPFLTEVDGEQRVEWHYTPIKAAGVTALLKGMSALMATEGDRRRMRIELNRADAKAALEDGGTNVVSIVKSRDELFST